MSPDSLRNLQVFVSRASRVRGEAYASDGRVSIRNRPNQDGEGALEAEVRGTDVYRVVIREDGTALDVACDCPHFEREFEICKHIWATLVEGVKSRAFGDRIFRELEIADDLLEEPVPRSLNPLAPKTPWKYGLPTGWVPRIVPRVPRWKEEIQTATRASRDSPDRALPPVFQFAYTIEIFSNSVMLEIGVRTPKRSGELSKPKLMDIPLADFSQLPDPLDRQILSILGSGAHEYEQTISHRRTVARAAVHYLMPILAATGRLSAEANGRTIDGIRWNENPWRFVLKVAAREHDFEISGVLRRGADEITIQSAITGAGLVLTGTELAPSIDDGATGFLMMLQKQPTIRVPSSAADELLRVLFASPALPEIELPPELSVELRRPDPVPILELAKSPFMPEFTGRISFDYDGSPVSPTWDEQRMYDESTRTAIVRDRVREQAFMATLWTSGFRRAHDGSAIISTKQLWNAVGTLAANGWRVEGSEGVFRSGGELSLSVSSGLDWFDLEGVAQFGAASADLPQILTAIRKGDAFVRLDDGTLGLIGDEWRRRLQPFSTSSAEHKNALRFRKSQALLLDTLLAARDDVQVDDAFRQARERFASIRPLSEDAAASFRGTLRPYQEEGLGWMTFMRELAFGGCLADDMGLGKTVQVLAMLCGRKQTDEAPFRPSLVVAPRSLIFNWRSEAQRFAPELRILEHASPQRSRNHEDFTNADLVLTTYGTLRRDAALFAAAEFDYAILDEAQAIKNASSQSAKAARLLRARHRLALTGTPIENHVGELWSLFQFLNPGLLGGSATRIPGWLKAAGAPGDEGKNARAIVGRVLRPLILRRTKAEVARELPERVEQTIVCELEPKQRAIYDELRTYYRESLLKRVDDAGMGRSKMHVLEALLRLRQAACHPALINALHAGAGSAKLDALISELTVLIEEDHKVLVFSQFTSFLALLRVELDQRGIHYEYLDGRTRDRAERVRRFQEDPAVSLFLISLKAGGLGLNLTAAEYVFLLDPWWNPAVEAQAIDRAHRIGQERTVVAYRLVARDTIEEKILQLQSHKQALADAILTEDNSVLRQLTREDLDLLLS